MGANFGIFLDIEPDTKQEIKEEKKSERKHLNIDKGIALLTATTLLSISMLGGTFLYTNSQKAEAKELLKMVSTQITEIQDSRKELEEKANLLSDEQYSNNIDILSKALTTLRKHEEDGLHGYFMANGGKYFVVKYDRATGQLFCLKTGEDGKREEGEPIVMSSNWVEALVSRMKAEK